MVRQIDWITNKIMYIVTYLSTANASQFHNFSEHCNSTSFFHLLLCRAAKENVWNKFQRVVFNFFFEKLSRHANSVQTRSRRTLGINSHQTTIWLPPNKKARILFQKAGISSSAPKTGGDLCEQNHLSDTDLNSSCSPNFGYIYWIYWIFFITLPGRNDENAPCFAW